MLNRKSLLAAAIAMGLANSSIAAPYSSFIVFGDSLSDAGQFTDTGGPADSTRRFTNRVGPTYLPGNGEAYAPVSTMLLGQRLGFSADEVAGSTSQARLDAGLPDGNNWAVGGDRTDQIYNAITQPNGSVAGTRTRDGYLISTGGVADPNALYYLTGGGNDFLQFRVLNTAQAYQAAGQLADGVAALQQAGGRNFMVWLLPDLGKTPSYYGTGLQSFVSGLANDFNDELVRRLSAIDANIIPLNIALTVDEILADPGRYGLSTTQNLFTCFSGCSNENPVYGISGTNPDPTQLLFNDSVHPTITGQRLIADYAYSLLAAPWEATVLPEMALNDLRSSQQQLRQQWAGDWYQWQPVGGWKTFINAQGQQQDYDVLNASGDSTALGVDIGASYRMDEHWRLGAAFGVTQNTLELGDADSRYELSSYLFSAFAQYQRERWWADAAATVGHLDYHDLKRKFSIGPAERAEKGDTEGQSWGFSGRVGYDIAPDAASAWHLSPYLAAEWTEVDVDGYRERSDSATALRFADQERDSKRLGIGLLGHYALSAQTRLTGDVQFMREYEDDTQDVTMSLKSVDALSYTLDGFTPDDKTWRASVGVTHQLQPGLAVGGSAFWTQADSGDQMGVGLSLNWSL